MNRSAVVSTLLVATLVAPAATATWSAFGSFEPDNALDSEQFMFFNAAPAGAQRVYFAAFTTTGAEANVNVAALQTSMEQATLEFHEAIFGVWVDCNGDGYVGMLESALYEYDSSLLLDDSICPAITGTANVWPSGAHNYNGWVTEMVPIGGIDSDPENDINDQRVYRDPAAMVWGDYGRPTDSAAAGGTCALTPLPRGTLASTGGMINYIGCPYPGVSARYNEIILGRDVASNILGEDAYPGLDPSNSLGLAIPQDEYGQLDARGHPILDQQTLGSEDSSGAAVSIVDCDAGPMFHSGDFFNGTPLGPSIPAAFQNDTIATISPAPTGTANPTVGGQNNQTQEELLEDCDTSNDAGHDTYGLLEGDFNGVSTARKKEADWNMQFADATRGSPWGLVLGSNGNAGTSNYWGVTPIQQTTGVGLAAWFSDSQLVKRGPRTATVNTYTGAVDIPDPAYFTFYAHAGQATRDRGFAFPGGSGAYGAAQCGDNTSGVHNGWECDTQYWYQNPDGTYTPEPYPFARPGSAYEFRDVDCYDGAIGESGVGAGTPFYGPNPCP